MSFETEQKLKDMLKWLSYSEVEFGHMDPDHRYQYLHDGLDMAIEVVKSLHADTLKLRQRADSASPLAIR